MAARAGRLATRSRGLRSAPRAPSYTTNRDVTVTYIAEGKETDGRPSIRYITLLREGARAHDLPEHWVRLLESVKHAE